MGKGRKKGGLGAKKASQQGQQKKDSPAADQGKDTPENKEENTTPTQPPAEKVSEDAPSTPAVTTAENGADNTVKSEDASVAPASTSSATSREEPREEASQEVTPPAASNADTQATAAAAPTPQSASAEPVAETAAPQEEAAGGGGWGAWGWGLVSTVAKAAGEGVKVIAEEAKEIGSEFQEAFTDIPDTVRQMSGTEEGAGGQEGTTGDSAAAAHVQPHVEDHEPGAGAMQHDEHAKHEDTRSAAHALQGIADDDAADPLAHASALGWGMLSKGVDLIGQAGSKVQGAVNSDTVKALSGKVQSLDLEQITTKAARIGESIAHSGVDALENVGKSAMTIFAEDGSTSDRPVYKRPAIPFLDTLGHADSQSAAPVVEAMEKVVSFEAQFSLDGGLTYIESLEQLSTECMVRASSVKHTDLQRSDMEEAVVRLQTILDTDHSECPEANGDDWQVSDVKGRFDVQVEAALATADEIVSEFKTYVNANIGNGQISEGQAQERFQLVGAGMDRLRSECAISLASLTSATVQEVARVCRDAAEVQDDGCRGDPDKLASFVRFLALHATSCLDKVSGGYTDAVRSVADSGKPVIDDLMSRAYREVKRDDGTVSRVDLPTDEVTTTLDVIDAETNEHTTGIFIDTGSATQYVHDAVQFTLPVCKDLVKV